MNRQEYDIIMGPGLSDRIGLVQRFIPKRLVYRDAIFNFHLNLAPWKKDPDNLDPKLNGLIDKIDSLAGRNISLVGISAFGSLALNGYTERRKAVSKVVIVCGRLNRGIGDFPPLALSAKRSGAFYESVIWAEENAANFTIEDRAKFMTISSIYDELVPAGTSTLEGAANMRIPVPEHVLAIAATMTIYRKRWLDFILQPN